MINPFKKIRDWFKPKRVHNIIVVSTNEELEKKIEEIEGNGRT